LITPPNRLTDFIGETKYTIKNLLCQGRYIKNMYGTILDNFLIIENKRVTQKHKKTKK